MKDSPNTGISLCPDILLLVWVQILGEVSSKFSGATIKHLIIFHSAMIHSKPQEWLMCPKVLWLIKKKKIESMSNTISYSFWKCFIYLLCHYKYNKTEQLFFYNKLLDKNIFIGLQRYSKGHILAIRHTLVLMLKLMLN